MIVDLCYDEDHKALFKSKQDTKWKLYNRSKNTSLDDVIQKNSKFNRKEDELKTNKIFFTFAFLNRR